MSCRGVAKKPCFPPWHCMTTTRDDQGHMTTGAMTDRRNLLTNQEANLRVKTVLKKRKQIYTRRRLNRNNNQKIKIQNEIPEVNNIPVAECLNNKFINNNVSPARSSENKSHQSS